MIKVDNTPNDSVWEWKVVKKSLLFKFYTWCVKKNVQYNKSYSYEDLGWYLSSYMRLYEELQVFLDL